MRSLCLALLVSVSFSSLGSNSFAQENKSISITVDGTKISIPLPADLVASKSELKSMANFMDKTTPTNKIHEIFAPKGTTEKTYLEKGLKRNCDVQTVRSLDNKMTQELFDGVKDILTKQFDEMIKKVMKELSEDSVQIDAVKKVATGAFVDEDDSYSYLFYSNVKTPKATIQRVSAASICFVNGNMILLNVHSNLDSEKDADWVKKTAKQWVEATLKANGDN